MGRCVKTAEAIAKACRVAAEICDELTDIDYCAWQFKTFEQARFQDPALFAAWFATPHLVLCVPKTSSAMHGGANPHLASALLHHTDSRVTEGVTIGHRASARAKACEASFRDT